MKNLLAAVAILASLAFASAAFATPNGPQGHPVDRADASTAEANPYQTTGSASAALQGYTTSRPGSSPVTIVATGGGSSFNWGDAGIGAAGAIGVALVLIGGSLVALRRRNRLAL
jgi:hypothetical protein